MDYFKINGKKYDVSVIEIKESFNILYSSKTGRTMATGARMTLDPLGTFFGHNVTVKRIPGKEKEYDEFYTKVSTPSYTGMKVEVAHKQKVLKYDAYISNGERTLERVASDGTLLWGEMTVNIVPMEAQVLPK